MRPGLPEDHFDPLDCLLDAACWPEPPAESVERLRRQWRSMARCRTRRRLPAVAVMLAAAVVLLVAILAFRGLRGPNGGRPASEDFVAALPHPPAPTVSGPPFPAPNHVAPKPSPRPAVLGEGPKAVAVTSRGRPPTAHELVLIVAARRQAGAPPSHSAGTAWPSPAARSGAANRNAARLRVVPGIPPEPRPDATAIGRLARQERDPRAQRELVASLLERGDLPSIRVFLQRVADPRTSGAALACVGREDPPVETLLEFLTAPDRGERMAAAQVLGRLDRPEISRRLIEMVRLGAYRQEALLGLLCSSEPSAREFLASAERDSTFWATLWNAKRLFETLALSRS